MKNVIAIAFGSVLLIGCLGVVIQSEPSTEVSSFIQQSMQLKSGMTKAEIHSMVGTPYVSSEHLKFDIFQVIGDRKDHVVMFLPALWFYETQEYTPVLLVTYHDDWTLKDYKWEFYDESETGDRKNLLIELDGYTLIHIGFDLTGMMLFAPAEVSEQVLSEQLLNGRCVLYLIAPDQPIEPENKRYNPLLTKLFINDKLLINWGGFPYSSRLSLKYWEKVISETVFIGFQLPVGEYELELKGNVRSSIKGSFTCVAGKANFANIRAELVDVWSDEGWTFGHRYRVKGGIYMSENWPKEIKDRRQILMYHDTWYGLDYQK